MYLPYMIWLLFFYLFCKCHGLKTLGDQHLPTIIWWTDLLYPHINEISKIKCPLGTCISSNKRNFTKINSTLAFMFYGTDFDPQKVPLPRRPSHLWALLHEESPMNNYILSHGPAISQFNYTSTFSRYSNYPLTTQHLPSIPHLTEQKPVPIEEKNKLRKDFAPVLYLQSHCLVASDRDRYVQELMKFIHIDSYGACLHNKDLPKHLSSTDTHNDPQLFEFISKYKFHIAFENAICDDYITEKLYRALHVGSIPIYKGSPSVKDWIPSNKSVILVDDFKNPKELAKFILLLDQNDDLYKQYLQFKETGITNDLLLKTIQEREWGVNDFSKIDFIQGFECYICDKLHSRNELPVVNKKHMNCPQPHQSLLSDTEKFTDEWLREDWIENYWFAYDQAKALQLMVENGDKDTSNFLNYILKYKYHN